MNNPYNKSGNYIYLEDVKCYRETKRLSNKQQEQSPEGIHSFSQWFIHSFTHSSRHSVSQSPLILPLNNSSIHSLTLAFACLLPHSSIPPRAHSPSSVSDPEPFPFLPCNMCRAAPLLDLCISGSQSLQCYFCSPAPAALGLQPAPPGSASDLQAG